MAESKKDTAKISPTPTDRWILLVEARIETDRLQDWFAWYEAHVPEILECEGWYAGGRFVEEEDDGTSVFWTVYEISGPAAFETEEFERVTGWREWAPHVRSRRHMLMPIGSWYRGGAA
jgi:hypothetical protein